MVNIYSIAGDVIDESRIDRDAIFLGDSKWSEDTGFLYTTLELQERRFRNQMSKFGFGSDAFA